MNFVFTGPAKVEGLHFERKHLIALAREKGHKVQQKMWFDTDYLVANPESLKKNTLKTRQAKLLQKKVITPAEFLKLMDML
jgi:NAD-dependent DNA ligase